MQANIETISKKEDRKMMVRRENGEINSHLRVSNGAFKKEGSKERIIVRREREN